MFIVLPFGLASACYVFTRSLVKKWRGSGIKEIMYTNDGIAAAESRQKCTEQQEIVVSDLKKVGFVLSASKSCSVPQLVYKWLGFIVNLYKGNFYIPKEKLESLISAIKSVHLLAKVPVRFLTSIVGKIISMSPAIGQVSRLRTRALYKAINARRSSCDSVTLPFDAQEELSFWYHNIDNLNTKPIWFSPGATRVVYSDASSTGYGGYIMAQCSCQSLFSFSSCRSRTKVALS